MLLYFFCDTILHALFYYYKLISLSFINLGEGVWIYAYVIHDPSIGVSHVHMYVSVFVRQLCIDLNIRSQYSTRTCLVCIIKQVFLRRLVAYKIYIYIYIYIYLYVLCFFVYIFSKPSQLQRTVSNTKSSSSKLNSGIRPNYNQVTNKK